MKKKKQEERMKLSDVIKTVLYNADSNSTILATKICVPGSSIRAWLSRNEFPAGKLLLITKLIGLPEDIETLRQKFDFRVVQGRRKMAHEVPNLMPLIRAIALTPLDELGYNALHYLIKMQVDIKEPLTTSLVAEVIKLLK